MSGKSKKVIIAIIVGILVIGLGSLVGWIAFNYFDSPEEVEHETNNYFDSPKEVEDETKRIAELEAYLKENYNKFVIDGSTSLIPLHEALEEKFGDGKEIKHSKTVAAWNDFVDGKIDILLAVDYLDSYFDDASRKNVEINQKEITKEALVFLKNKSLKVDNLTLEQVKQIYDGTITNWREITGNYVDYIEGYYDEMSITPIYRNEDSGSGMALIKLFGNEVNCTSNNCLFIADMAGIVNALATGLVGEFGDKLIAYNMYTFTEKQYHNDEVETFKINGVEPNDETIYSGKYPIVLYNYIYYKNDEAKEFGEKLYEYLTSSAGQKLIMENGYVPLEKQEQVDYKDTERDCKDNFVDEVCVVSPGYNAILDKYVKIIITDDKEEFEYFDTVEEYIFANSDITKEQFDNLSDFLDVVIEKTLNYSKDAIIEDITFNLEDDGNIRMDSGFCGGTACIWFKPNENYSYWATENSKGMDYLVSGTFYISSDYKTISGKDFNWNEDIGDYAEITFTIPIEDFDKAFDIEFGF